MQLQLPEVQRGATSQSLRCSIGSLWQVMSIWLGHAIITIGNIWKLCWISCYLVTFNQPCFSVIHPLKKRWHFCFLAGATSSQASAEKALQAVLEEMPHVLPFEVGNGQMWRAVNTPSRRMDYPVDVCWYVLIMAVTASLTCFQYVRHCKKLGWRSTGNNESYRKVFISCELCWGCLSCGLEDVTCNPIVNAVSLFIWTLLPGFLCRVSTLHFVWRRVLGNPTETWFIPPSS